MKEFFLPFCHPLVMVFHTYISFTDSFIDPFTKLSKILDKDTFIISMRFKSFLNCCHVLLFNFNFYQWISFTNLSFHVFITIVFVTLSHRAQEFTRYIFHSIEVIEGKFRDRLGEMIVLLLKIRCVDIP